MAGPYASVSNYEEGMQQSEANRRARLGEISEDIAAQGAARNMQQSQAIDQAIRGSYASSQPTQPSQDQSGAPNITSGQTQVQAVPVSLKSDTSQMPMAQGQPVNVQQVSASDLTPPVSRVPALSAQQIPPPPATAFQNVPVSGQPEAMNITPPTQGYTPPGTPVVPSTGAPLPQEKPPVPAAQPLPQASPFDTPQFQQQLADHLAQAPGGGEELMKIKASRDTTIGTVMQMIEQGHTDEARFTAQRNGLNIPEQFYQNSDLAAGMNYASKAYPEDPDKGQAFFHTYIQTPGDVNAKVQAGMQVAGAPTSQAQKELLKAMAVMRSNYQIKNADGTYGLAFANPMTGTLTPYRAPDGSQPNVTGGYAFHAGNGSASAGGVTERIIAGLQNEAKQNGQTLSYADALALAKRAPNADQGELRRETLAYNAASNDFSLKNPDGSRPSLEQKIAHYRQIYGVKQPVVSAGPGRTPLSQQQIQVIGPAYDPLGNPSFGAPAAAQPSGDGRVVVQGPQGDKYRILPTDLDEALKDGYQQVQ